MKTAPGGNMRRFNASDKASRISGEIHSRERKCLYRGVNNIWRTVVEVFRTLCGRYDYGEWPVGPNPYDRMRCHERGVKVIELQAQIQNLANRASAPPMLTRTGKSEMGWIINVHITANYLHWMVERMAQNARDDCVFTTEPPKVSRWLWGA